MTKYLWLINENEWKEAKTFIDTLPKKSILVNEDNYFIGELYSIIEIY